MHVCCYFQLESKPWRRSLTMSNQKSEMKAQYCGQQEMIDRIIPITDPQPSLLTDHHEEGVTKVVLFQPLYAVHSLSCFPFSFHTFFLPLYLTLIIIPDLSPYICISLFFSLFHSFSHSFNLSLFSSSILPHSFPPPSPSSSHPHPSPHLSFSQDLVPSTRVKKRSERELTAVNDSVLDKNQPYLTTNNR